MELSFQIVDFRPCKPASDFEEDAIRHIYKAVEALHVRVTILEDYIDESKLVEEFGGRICSLENLLRKRSSSIVSAPFECPAVNCAQGFQRLNTVQSHIRKSQRFGHRFPREIIDRRYCLQCNKDFGNLATHDKTCHQEPSNSRFDSFKSFLGNNLCESVPEAMGSSCDRSEVDSDNRRAEKEQHADLEAGLDHENPSSALDEVVSSASDQTERSTEQCDSELIVCPSNNPDAHFKPSLPRPTTLSNNLNDPMQASAYDYDCISSTDSSHNQLQNVPSEVQNLKTTIKTLSQIIREMEIEREALDKGQQELARRSQTLERDLERAEQVYREVVADKDRLEKEKYSLSQQLNDADEKEKRNLQLIQDLEQQTRHNVKSPSEADFASEGRSRTYTSLSTNFHNRKQTTGYDYIFDFSIDSNGDLAQHPAPIFAMTASLPIDSNDWMRTSGYDYNQDFFVNDSSNLVECPVYIGNQTTGPPIDFSNRSQDLGCDYGFNVTADSCSNLARSLPPPIQNIGLTPTFGNRTQASGNNELQTCATYSSGNQLYTHLSAPPTVSCGESPKSVPTTPNSVKRKRSATECQDATNV